MYITFLPLETKEVFAQAVEIVALVLVVYFGIRFIPGFFTDKKDGKISPELSAINDLTSKKDILVSELRGLREDLRNRGDSNDRPKQ